MRACRKCAARLASKPLHAKLPSVVVSAAAIVPAHLYAVWALCQSTEKFAQSFGMKLSGCVHSLNIAPKTGFEGNPTLYFGRRFCFSFISGRHPKGAKPPLPEHKSHFFTPRSRD